MTHYVIYDGNCNLCVAVTQLLAQFDQGQRFKYDWFGQRTMPHTISYPGGCMEEEQR